MDAQIFYRFKDSLDDVMFRYSFCSLIIIVLNCLIFLGFQSAIIIIGSYVAGIYLFHLLTKYKNDVDNFLSVFTENILVRHQEKPVLQVQLHSELSGSCGKVLTSPDIDEALEQFLNRVLEKYVSNWYSVISQDWAFHYEVRSSVKYAVSEIYGRINKVDFNNFLLKKLVPTCLQHVGSSSELKKHVDINNLHIAVHSRRSEILYLQSVSKCLLKYLLPKSGLTCRSYSLLLREILSRSLLLPLSDVVCNPATLNSLMLILLNNNFKLSSNDSLVVEKVELLRKFVLKYKADPLYSELRPDVGTIMKNPDLLKAFMQYLRNLNADHILQFCVDIESFNEKILKPDLNSNELDVLFHDAWVIYSLYFSTRSPNCIQFKNDYASQLCKILNKDVVKLRTTSTLSEAYEEAYVILESHCYDFHSSSEFCNWLYGRCDSADFSKSRSSTPLDLSPQKGNASKKTMFELGSKFNKIKDALKPNSVLEGQTFDMQSAQVQSETSFTEMGEDVQLIVTNERNMNHWNISIPTVGSRLDSSNKPYTVFIIQIRDTDKNEWLVERRPVDFYSLDAKLTEFHGNFVDAYLPPRRLLTTRQESIELYEEYLNRLIKNSKLKSSDLLYTFLTSTEDFEEEENSFGKLFRKSVVPTLRKERGQNLESFINSFIISCRTTKYEWKDVNEKISTLKPPASVSIYDNNFNIGADISQQIFFSREYKQHSNTILDTPSKCLLLFGTMVYEWKEAALKVLFSIHSLVGGAVDRLVMYFTHRYLQRVITSSNIAYLINVVEWALFDNTTKIDPLEVRKELVEKVNNLKETSWFYHVYKFIFDNLQDSKVNKQFYYTVMDCVLEELFPELVTASLK